LKAVQELAGPWEVVFDPKWGGPVKKEVSSQKSEVSRNGGVSFDKLISWTERPEEGIKYYSGTAVYRKAFDLPKSAIGNRQSEIFLSLGVVHELARVRLNGKDLGVVWCAPWRVDISSAVKEGTNELEIEVVNLWANRLIGDAALPENQRFSWTFVAHGHRADSKLLSSGLLGPVQILGTEF